VTTLKTGTSAYPWRPDISFFAANEVVGDALILQTAVKAGEVDGDQPTVRCAYVDDAAANWISEAAEIPEASPGLAEVVVTTGKVSQLIRVSREQFNQAQTARQLSESAARALVKKADAEYIAGTTPLKGLINIPGTVGGSSYYVDSDLDGVSNLIANIQKSGGNPSHIVLDPLGFANFRNLKVLTSGSAQPLLGAGTEDMQPRLFNLPIIVNRFVPAYSGLLIDRNAVVAAVGPVQVSVSEHQYFSSDSIGLRATWRIGWNIVRPSWVGKFHMTVLGS
jgi:HK97 family phage major capsid protein